MSGIKDMISEKAISWGLMGYIDFVYRTSKVIRRGRFDLLRSESEEKSVLLFWHGNSFSFFPALKGGEVLVVTTRDRRGDYISNVCRHNGYATVRLPDGTDGGNYLFKIRKLLKDNPKHLAISLDGPLGPYHVPKDFAFVMAQLLKQRVIPMTIEVKRKIVLKSRWDKYEIPLPFNRIVIDAKEPIEVTREDGKERFASLKERVLEAMD